LIIADAFSDGILEHMITRKVRGFKIVALMTESNLIQARYGHLIQVLHTREELKSTIDQSPIDEVIYCKRYVEMDLIREVEEICNEIGIKFRIQTDVNPLDPVVFQSRIIRNRTDLSTGGTPANNISHVFKVLSDFIFPVMGMALLVPFFLLIAIAIKTGSRGPVFFSQERVGRGGRKFRIIKFRTMIVHAEDQTGLLGTMSLVSGPVFKIRHDPRITVIGRILRKTGLDELPQLYNVMRGEMSLIGPRPPLEVEVSQYERWQIRRLSVKPGITCYWQVSPNRHEISFEKWMEMDLHYIDNWNIAKDFILFIRTIQTFFRADGE